MSLSVDNTLLNVRIRNSLSTRAHVKQPQVHVMGVFLACNSQYMYTQLGSCSLIKCKIICGGLTCHFGSTKVRNASLAWLSSVHVPYLKQPTKNLSRISTQWLGLKQSIICILELYDTCSKKGCKLQVYTSQSFASTMHSRKTFVTFASQVRVLQTQKIICACVSVCAWIANSLRSYTCFH